MKPRLIALLLTCSVATLAAQNLPEPWHSAWQARDLAALGRLLRAEAPARWPVDVHGQTLLHRAPAREAAQTQAPLFKLLLDAGADVQARDRYGQTALFPAAAHGCLPCMDALLGAGLLPDTPRDDGQTPLHHADAAAQARLLAAGANPAARNRLGQVPLHTNRRPGAGLLTPGINVRDLAGLTPLHLAALDGDVDRLRWLLAHGADPSLRTTAPFDYRDPLLADVWAQVTRLEAGQRAYDFAAWQHERSKWSTGSHAGAEALLDEVTPRRGLFRR